MNLIASAVLAFFSTTMDDFAVIVMFFGKAQQFENVSLAYIRVFLGLILGFTIVIILSCFGLLLGAFIPSKYVALIGFFPLFIGLKGLFELLREHGCFVSLGINPPAEDVSDGQNEDNNDGNGDIELHIEGTRVVDGRGGEK